MSRSAACHVYWASTSWLRPAHHGLLSDIERDRRDSYLRAADRDRFALGAVILRLVAARHTGLAPEQVEIFRTCERCGENHGPPRIGGAPVHVSVTHSGRFAGVALTRAGPVGIDTEEIKPLDDYADLVEAIRAPEEPGTCASVTSFYKMWTRKESVLKAAGVGLRDAMTEVGVTSPDEPPRLLRWRSERCPRAFMCAVSPAGGYVGAVTVFTREQVSLEERSY
jgi:4'-phosphopantetheinyl transferase